MPRKAVSTEIISYSGAFYGKAIVSMINSDSIYAPYTYDDRNEYMPAPKEIEAKGHEFTFSIPAHSFTQTMLKIR